MTIAHWTGRRVAAIWIAGFVLQTLIVVGPVWLALRYARQGAPSLMQEMDTLDARWRTAEAADSQQIAKQRAAGATALGPRGESLYAVVRVPSGRPDPAAVAAFRQRNDRRARWFLLVQVGLVPAVLLTLTAAWVVARQRTPGSDTAARAA